MQEFFQISGAKQLSGKVSVSGAKNGALPLLIATLLSAEPIIVRNVPRLEDIGVLRSLLEQLGARVESLNAHDYKLSTPRLIATETSYSLVKALRASFWVLAPLLARGGAARVALPGGDIIGARPVDIHLEALTKMGADIKVKHGVVLAEAPHGLKPAEIDFRFPSVGATHQILMAASIVPGTTVLRGAAREPEVIALCDLLSSMGAKIEGIGQSTLSITGQEQLCGAEISVLGDRIEAATMLCAAAATQGRVLVQGFTPAHLGSFIDVLQQLGVSLEQHADSVFIDASNGLNAVHVTTAPYPGLATDIQAPLMAALALARGESRIEETMFEGRFGHVSELARLGAKIRIQGHSAIITGVERLTGAPVEATDIRAAAALVIGGLAAHGVTRISEPFHLRRGYDGLVAKLRGLGADVGTGVTDPDDVVLSGC